MTPHQAILPNALFESRIGKVVGPIFLAILGTLIIAISAKIKVPMWPVETSLQTLAVFVIAATFGFRLGLATIGLYLVEGAFGLPVFQGTPERGIGLAYMAGPTGGYLVGYVIMTGLTGWAADRGFWKSPLRIGSAMLVGEVIMLTCGALWLAVLFGADKAFDYGVGPFILPDLVKVGIAACLASLAGRSLRNLR